MYIPRLDGNFDLYQGDWNGSHQHGKGLTLRPAKYLQIGYKRMGLDHVPFTRIYADGTVTEGSYSDNKKDGVWKDYFTDGDIDESFWRRGELVITN